MIVSWVRSFICYKYEIYFSEKDCSRNWMVLATQLVALPYTLYFSYNLEAFISIKELNNLLINISFVVKWCLPISIFNTKYWSSPISQILLKYDYLILGVMAAMSFSVKTLNQLCIFSITNLGISRANRWRLVYMLNYFMECLLS